MKLLLMYNSENSGKTSDIIMTNNDSQKTIVTKNDLFDVLDLIDSLGIRYWVDGGWGVDLLAGTQSREHRDIDIDFDGEYLDLLLNTLQKSGYTIETDERPCRIELYHSRWGYLDIHPLVIAANGNAKQSDGKNGWYEFQASYFTTVLFETRQIACISLEGQLLFHTGYELREKDIADLQLLNTLSESLFRKHCETVNQYLDFFCKKLSSRCVGTVGNRKATDYFRRKLLNFGWETEETSFSTMAWRTEGATLRCGSASFTVESSFYSSGCSVQAELVDADSIEKLEQGDLSNKIVLLYGELAKEPLMPKNFVFYNPDEHKRIITALEKSGVSAIVTATARHSALAGGVYPFPMIEDGDFDIPSVFMTEEEGNRLLNYCGRSVSLQSSAIRITSSGCNVTGKKSGNDKKRIVITAHIDAKPGTPGAIDNATGIIVLLLLADFIKNNSFADKTIELLAINGEDYYSVPGQMAFLRQNEEKFGDILLNINIDCAGYKEGKTAVTLFNVPEKVRQATTEFMMKGEDFVEGIPWYQGDHTLFLQNEVPAVVFTSQWFLENMETQSITHTSKDSPEIVCPQSIVKIAEAIRHLLYRV